jgi:hypothetical protein
MDPRNPMVTIFALINRFSAHGFLANQIVDPQLFYPTSLIYDIDIFAENPLRVNYPWPRACCRCSHAGVARPAHLMGHSGWQWLPHYLPHNQPDLPASGGPGLPPDCTCTPHSPPLLTAAGFTCPLLGLCSAKHKVAAT